MITFLRRKEICLSILCINLFYLNCLVGTVLNEQMSSTVYHSLDLCPNHNSWFFQHRNKHLAILGKREIAAI